MQTSLLQKNDLRCAQAYFYNGLCQILEDGQKQTKLHELKASVKKLASDIKVKYQNSKQKEAIRKALKEQVANITFLAESLSQDKKFINGYLAYDVFDGIVISARLADNRHYDIVVKQDPQRSVAWVFSPSTEDEFDSIKAQIEAEQDYEIPCIDVIVKGPELLPKKPQEIVSVKLTERNDKIDETILGKVLFSKKDQYVLKSEQEQDEIKGFLYEQHAKTVQPLDILVLENQEEQKKIFSRVAKINMNPLSGGGYVHQFSEVVTHVLFRPLREVAADYDGRPRPTDLSGFIIRRPSDKELLDVLNIPDFGMPIGKLDYNGGGEPFLYPLKPMDTIYQSMLVAGVQGKGKSNFIKLMVKSLCSNKHIPADKRPAVIILDGEPEYTDFAKKSEMIQSSINFLEKYGIGDIKPKIYSLHKDPVKSDATLSLRGISRQDTIYLMPEVESRTENILRLLISHVGNQIDQEQAPQDIETLRTRLLAEVNRSSLVHISQRPAIARAVLSPSLNMLDQKDKTPLTPQLLFKPGSITVIDYHSLDHNMKRVVVLYLLQLLDQYKMNTPNVDPGVLLVIDEAEQLFPQSPSKGEKDFVQRIAERMEDITNRGRKRKYGVTLVTHLPTEVSKKVGDLTNTKVAFGLSGSEKWIRDYFGKEYVSEINSLPTGYCRISIKVNRENQGPINARLKIPYIGNKEALPEEIE
ncbi:MAG: DUF87 domain-containing protein [Nitrosarchaeum sp.]|nr:DUF87 domain-containing protein [Nitrosarchaeum sp.]